MLQITLKCLDGTESAVLVEYLVPEVQRIRAGRLSASVWEPARPPVTERFLFAGLADDGRPVFQQVYA